MTSAQPVPPGMHTLTPHLVCHSAVDAIMFYIKAFDASELVRRVGPDGRLMHAVLRIGDSPLMLIDEHPDSASLPARATGAAGRGLSSH